MARRGRGRKPRRDVPAANGRRLGGGWEGGGAGWRFSPRDGRGLVQVVHGLLARSEAPGGFAKRSASSRWTHLGKPGSEGPAVMPRAAGWFRPGAGIWEGAWIWLDWEHGRWSASADHDALGAWPPLMGQWFGLLVLHRAGLSDGPVMRATHTDLSYGPVIRATHADQITRTKSCGPVMRSCHKDGAAPEPAP